MDWILAGKALLIVLGTVIGFVGFVSLIDKYPTIGGLVLVVVMILVFTALIYKVLGG